MEFSLNNVPETPTKPQVNYQKPGIVENLKVTEVVLLETGTNKVPYMEIRTESPDGAIGRSSKMFFSTDVKPGKKMSGWDVSARNIRDFITATHNVNSNTAKELFGTPNSKESIVNKVSALLVGRTFRGKFKGEQGANGSIYSSIGQVESMIVPKEESRLKYNPDTDIKKYVVYNPSETTADPNTNGEDLPF